MATKIIGRTEMRNMRPGDVKAGDAFAIKVVALAGYAGDWTAYVGPSDWPDERVLKEGNKLVEFQVGDLFYVMRDRVYRE